MNIKEFLKELGMPSFDAEGYPLLGGAALLVVIGALLWSVFAWIGGIALILGAWHFRKVNRVAPDEDSNIIVAPIDGTVKEVEKVTIPADFPEAGQATMCIRIKSALLDSQMFFAPQDGLITSSNNTHMPVFSKGDLEMERGDRQCFAIATQERIYAVITAPMLGRKLLDNTANGKDLKMGEPLGMGRIGCTVELYLPANAKINLKDGQHMIGGETVIAQFSGKKKAAETKSEDDSE